MILFELTGSEHHPAYAALEVDNDERQYALIGSLVRAALAVDRPLLSHAVIKALNYHVIAGLHTHAGEYRPCPVQVGDYVPPEHYRVQALMDDFIDQTDRAWEATEPVGLAAFVLWRINHIHPFINGNGRTARAASYFTLCVKLGGLLRGAPILPELLRRERERYVAALMEADRSLATGMLDLSALAALMQELLAEQIAAAQ